MHSVLRASERVFSKVTGEPKIGEKSSKRLLPGHLAVTDAKDAVLVTVLGSCVAACVRNPVTGAGGMNHFMLPEGESGDWQGANDPGRFGNFAMDEIIATVLKYGGRAQDLEIKLFGGAELYPGTISVGARNIQFVRGYLQKHGLRSAVEDLGGALGRKIIYTPRTGQAFRKTLIPHSEKELMRMERAYRDQIARFHSARSDARNSICRLVKPVC